MSQSNILDTFYIIDFDRTLARSDDLRLLFEEVAFEETAIPAEQIKQGELIYRNNFDVAGYLRNLLKQEAPNSDAETVVARVKKLFVEKGLQEDFLEPYAAQLLEELAKKDMAFGILTSGGEEWQRAKIQASGLDRIPHMIIGTVKKSELMAEWKQPDGMFLLPDTLTGRGICRARRIVFLDDKPVSFEGIPEGVEGIWVLPIRSAVAYDIKKLEVPPQVRHAHGLHAARDLIF